MPTVIFSERLVALRKSHQELLDALVIAAAALKNAGKEEAKIAEQAIRTAIKVTNS